MSCEIRMVKLILYLFNIVLVLCGVLLIVFGAMLFSDVHSFGDFAEAVKSQQIPISLIVLGAIVVVIAMFGCCATLRESYCMSMTYSIILFVLTIAQLALVIYMWANKDEYLKEMGRIVDKAWSRRTERASYMDAMQIGFKCCGKDDYQNYRFQGYFPSSCCDDVNNCSAATVYREGCKSAFVRFWDTKSDIIKYVGLIIAAVEFAGFVFACCIANNIRNERRRASY